MQLNRWVDSYHWLVLIADEFVRTTPDVIRDALKRHRPITYSAATALIARLGHVPEGFICDRARTQRPHKRTQVQIVRDQVVAKLKDYSRDSDELHPNIIDTIEESLFMAVLPEDTLREFVAMGNPGILIATTLRYCYGQTPQFAETIPLLDVWGRLFRRGFEQKREDRRFYEVWRIVRATVHDRHGSQKQLFARLGFRSRRSEDLDTSGRLEVLRIRGALLPDQVSGVFRTYADYTTFLHEVVIC